MDSNDSNDARDTNESKYVTLISSDGFEFVILREATLISPTIKGMLKGPFAEAKDSRCSFPEIRYGFHHQHTSSLFTSHTFLFNLALSSIPILSIHQPHSG